MAKIILFWCFENINFLGRIMEFQVQFWHPSDLRLWRTGCAIYVKIDWWNSNVQCCWTCLQRKISKIIDPSTPQNHLLLFISMWDTLYHIESFDSKFFMSGFTWKLEDFLNMCSFGYVVIGKPILNKPRKLPNFHVNPGIKNFELKISKW